jgi:hypothetical protein
LKLQVENAARESQSGSAETDRPAADNPKS